MEPPHLSKHWAAHALSAIGLLVSFVAAAVGGLALHADLPVAHRVVSRTLQDSLAHTLGGKVLVAPLERISFTHVSVAKLTLLDVYSHPVVELTGVRVDLSLRTLLHDVLFGPSTGAIVVSHVQVAHAVVSLLPDPKTGEPTLVRAASPARSAAPSKTGAASADILLPSIELGEAIVRNRLPELPRLEARLRSVHGRVRGGDRGVSVDVDRFGIALRGAKIPAHGTGTFALRAPGPLQSSFEGFVGNVEVRGAATLDGSHLDVTADVPRITPKAARALLPDWPVSEPVTAHAEARGDLPNLTAHVKLGARRATLALDGPVTVGDKAHAVLTVKAQHLDGHAFEAALPVTDVGLDGAMDAHLDGERVTADITLHLPPSTVQGQPVPAIDVHAALADGAVTGTLKVHETGLPVSATFKVSPTLAVDFDAETADVPLASIQRLELHGVRGRGKVHVRAHVEGQTVRGTVDGEFGGLATGAAELGRARLHADVSGPLTEPQKIHGTARVEASSARLSGVDLDKIVLNARGSVAALDFDADLQRSGGPALTAKGKGQLSPRPLLGRTEVVLSQGPVRIEGEVASLDVEHGSAAIENVKISGAGGAVTGAVRFAPNLLEVTAAGEGVDLEALARAMGLPRGELAGTMRIDTELAIGRDVTRGHVRLGLGNATLGPVGGLSLQLSADLDDSHVTGSASGLVAGIGTFGTTFDTTLDGFPLEPASWRRATGQAEVQVSDVELALLTALLPRESPVDRIFGKAYGRILLERKSPQVPLPNVFATVSTRRLVVGMRAAEGAEAKRISGIDLTATGQLDAATGDATGTTLAADAHGDLLTATGAVHVDVPRLVKEPARALAQLVDTPVDIVVTVPAHRLAELPEPVRQTALSGTVSGVASLRGTLSHPMLFASVQGKDIVPAGSAGARPVDLHADAQYQWGSKEVSARATAAVAGRDAGTVTARGMLPGGLDSFRGTVRLALNEMPFDALGISGDRALGGSVVGTATLSRTDAGGTLGAELRVVDAVIEHTALGEGSLEVKTSGTDLNATIAFQGQRGSLEASASVPYTWSGSLPKVATTAPIRARLVTRDFPAVALAPAVTAVLSRIGGRLDTELSLELVPTTVGTETTWAGGIEGKAALREGSVLIDALGLEVADLTATAESHGQGSTTRISIRDVVGHVRSAKQNLRGKADLVMEGVRVTQGTAELDADDMPILFRGAPQGRITGHADARLSRQADRMQVDIDLPRLVLLLPQASSRKVQDLADNPEISVLQFAHGGEKEPLAMPWRLSLNLGSAVSLRRADVDLRLTGAPVLDLGDEAVASGSIQLVPGGRIPVLGKVFSVEEGTVLFDTGDPADPHVNLRAVGRAANDSLIYVEVTGTMGDAKISLRSDPPLPEAQVFALLLGGSSSDTDTTTTGTQSNASGAGAVALGSGVAMGVNQLVANSPIEVRVDTTEQNQPRYTAAVRIRENLWFEASEYEQANYGASSSTNTNVVAGTVDYRFTNRWSLKTEVGTAGGALDLLWQYRY